MTKKEKKAEFESAPLSPLAKLSLLLVRKFFEAKGYIFYHDALVVFLIKGTHAQKVTRNVHFSHLVTVKNNLV